MVETRDIVLMKETYFIRDQAAIINSSSFTHLVSATEECHLC